MNEDLPWSRPHIFTSILVYTESPQTILNARLVCKSWNNWLKSSSNYNLWTKLLKRFRNTLVTRIKSECSGRDFEKHLLEATCYRLERLFHQTALMKLDAAQSFDLCLKISKIENQLSKRLVPKYNPNTLNTTLNLNALMNEEQGIKSFGPINSFIRLKVDNLRVRTIVSQYLYRYLSCIVVDKVEKNKSDVQRLVLSSMGGHFQNPLFSAQSWVFEYFNTADEEENKVEEQVFGLSQVFPEEQGVLPQDAVEPSSSKAALGKRPLDVNLEDTTISNKKQKIENREESIFDCQPFCANNFYPTILELLDIDNLILKKLLIKKYSIDKTIVVPRLDEIVLHQDSFLHILPENWEAIGVDQDGNVSKFKQCKESVKECETAVVKFVDNIPLPALPTNRTEQILFWGGPDIRNRWSKFTDHLSGKQSEQVKTVGKKDFLRAFVLDMSPGSTETPDIPSDLPGLQQFLSARGVSLHTVTD